MNIVDNGKWISLHAYVMQNWVTVPMTILLQRVVDGIGANNLIIVIMEALQKGGR
jgi:hypothetical protein